MGLARTMTLKASAAGLALGGGKAVLIDDSVPELRDARLIEAAGVIDELGGAYVTAEDIGTTTADMDLMSRHTPYVVGRSVERGGGGDPSPVTAETVFRAILCGLRAAAGTDDASERRVGVIGLGKVGYSLAGKLAAAGAEVVACDLDAARAERFAAEHGGSVAPSAEAVLAMDLDVIAPCAAGGMIDDALARSLSCRVLAGAANNPLTSRDVARTLARRGILYAPDFLANCGGLIHVAREWYGEDGPDEAELVDRAEESLERAIATAAAEDSTPAGGRRAPGARAGGGRSRVSAGLPLAERLYTRAGLQSEFEPVATRRTFEEAVDQIAEKVKAGDLHVGDRLPSERELAARMRISRPTLREAIKVLAEAGVLEVRRGQSGGIFVASELVPRELLRSRQEIRVSEVAGVLEARRLLEPRVAQLAAVHAGEEDFAAMAALIERKRELAARDDVLRHEDLFLQLDLKFHLAMAHATRNSTVVSLMRSLFKRARDRARHGGARAARARLGDRRARAHAVGDPQCRLRRHRSGDGRAPGPAGADLGAGDRPRAGATAARLPAARRRPLAGIARGLAVPVRCRACGDGARPGWRGVVAMLAVACPTASAQAPASCPGSFEVMHFDQIGALKLTPGPYSITVLNQDALTCADASEPVPPVSRGLRRADLAEAGG